MPGRSRRFTSRNDGNVWPKSRSRLSDITFNTRSYTAPTIASKTARFGVPASPRGLIVMLHGSGGSGKFIEQAESRAFALKTISKGYAVLWPESEDVAGGGP